MALIETEEAAGRLARVIVSDIEIYNRQKIASGGDLSRELEEGYSLFQSRVVPALLPLFESVLSDRGLLAGKLPRSLAGAAARYKDLRAQAGEKAEAAAVAQPVAAELTEPVAAPVMEAAPVAPIVPEVAAPRLSAPAATAEANRADEPRAEEVTPPPAATAEDPTTQAARRLARVIVSDIVIYNTKKIEAGEPLTHEINEGRALFRARVGAEHAGILEALLVERGLVRAPQAESPAEAAPRGPAVVPPSGPRPGTRRPSVELPTPVVEVAPFLDRPTPLVEAPVEVATPVVQVEPEPASDSPWRRSPAAPVAVPGAGSGPVRLTTPARVAAASYAPVGGSPRTATPVRVSTPAGTPARVEGAAAGPLRLTTPAGTAARSATPAGTPAAREEALAGGPARAATPAGTRPRSLSDSPWDLPASSAASEADLGSRPRPRPAPPPIPAEARTPPPRPVFEAGFAKPAFVDAAFAEPAKQPEAPGDDGIMTSAVDLPQASAPARAASPAVGTPTDLPSLADLAAMHPVPAPGLTPAAAAPAPFALAAPPSAPPAEPAPRPALLDAPAPDTVLAPLAAKAAPRSPAKSRLLIAGAAILVAAAVTYYVLSFWPQR